MRQLITFLTLMGIVFAGRPAVALAQSEEAAPRLWDAAVSLGLLLGHPPTPGMTVYGEDTYPALPTSVTIGRYWTTHLKTEIETAFSTEGNRFVAYQATVPDSPWPASYSADQFHRLTSVAAGVTWQFRSNQWVHPYVQGGVALDWDRSRTEIARQTFYFPRNSPSDPLRAIEITPDRQIGPDTRTAVRALVSTGAKFYVTTRAYVRADARAAFGNRLAHVTVRCGFGVDF